MHTGILQPIVGNFDKDFKISERFKTIQANNEHWKKYKSIINIPDTQLIGLDETGPFDGMKELGLIVNSHNTNQFGTNLFIDNVRLRFINTGEVIKYNNGNWVTSNPVKENHTLSDYTKLNLEIISGSYNDLYRGLVKRDNYIVSEIFNNGVKLILFTSGMGIDDYEFDTTTLSGVNNLLSAMELNISPGMYWAIISNGEIGEYSTNLAKMLKEYGSFVPILNPDSKYCCVGKGMNIIEEDYMIDIGDDSLLPSISMDIYVDKEGYSGYRKLETGLEYVQEDLLTNISEVNNITCSKIVNSGYTLFIVDEDNYLFKFALMEPYDINTIKYGSKMKLNYADTPTSIDEFNNGEKLLLLYSSMNSVVSLNFSVPYHLYSVTEGLIYNFGGEISDAISINTESNNLYITDSQKRIYEYVLLSDLNGIIYKNSIESLYESMDYITSMCISVNKIYLTKPSGTVIEFTMDKPYTLSTIHVTTKKMYDVNHIDTDMSDIDTNPGESKLFVSYKSNSLISEHDLTIE